MSMPSLAHSGSNITRVSSASVAFRGSRLRLCGGVVRRAGPNHVGLTRCRIGSGTFSTSFKH
eukprot:10630796-Alexandrium_andersonii.AAC.1